MTKPKLRFKDKNGNAYPEWSQEKIGNLTKIYDGTHQTPKYTDKGIKFLSVENISDIQASNKFISEEAYNTEFKVKPEVNDILMTRIGDIGTPALINTNEQYAYYVSLALIKCSRQLLPKWLVQAILSNSFQKQLYKRTLHVAFPKKINKGEIGECIVNYPCLEEQEKIAEFFSKADEFINECEGEVKDLEEQKKGLMQKIFSQQIRFKDSNNNPYPDWEETKLEEIYNFKYGLYNNNPDNGGQYPVYGANGVIGGYTEYNAENSVIIGHMGAYAGSVLFEKNKHFVTYNGTITTPKDINKLNSKYGYFLLLNLNIRKICDGSGQPFLSYDTLNRIKAKVSKNLEEQEKIAKVLSKMDELIEEKKALLSDWQQFKKGLLQQMFV